MYVSDPGLRRVIPLPKMPIPVHCNEQIVLRFSIIKTSENQVKVKSVRIPTCEFGRGSISFFLCTANDGKWRWKRQEASVECSRKTYQGAVKDDPIYGIHFNGVRHKGNLYWVMGVTCMLVYSFSNEVFRIQQLPVRSFRAGMLCKSEGLLHYWEPKSTLPGFFLWRHDDASDEDRPWRQQKGITFHELSRCVRPLFFNYDLQTLYLGENPCSGEVYSYSLETKTLVIHPCLTSYGEKEARYFNMEYYHGFPFQLY